MNSLIRETLTCGSHPLFLFILVGKYFIDFFFAAIEGGRSRVDLCVGLDSAGGFWDGWGACEAVLGMCVHVCVSGGWGVLSLLIAPTPSHPLKEPITAVILQPS